MHLICIDFLIIIDLYYIDTLDLIIFAMWVMLYESCCFVQDMFLAMQMFV